MRAMRGPSGQVCRPFHRSASSCWARTPLHALRCSSRRFPTFFASVYLEIQLSDSNDKTRTMVLQTVLVINMLSSLVTCTWTRTIARSRTSMNFRILPQLTPQGLEALVQLDVLDLHSNQVRLMENLSHLRDLRVLNLAGNAIQRIDGCARLSFTFFSPNLHTWEPFPRQVFSSFSLVSNPLISFDAGVGFQCLQENHGSTRPSLVV
jgi:hypothetical protein